MAGIMSFGDIFQAQRLEGDEIGTYYQHGEDGFLIFGRG